MKRICTAIIAALIISISAYAAFSPISTATWTSNFTKVDIVEKMEEQPGDLTVHIIVSEPFRLSDYVELVEEDEEEISDEQESSDEVVDDIGLDTEAENSMNGTASYEEDGAPVTNTATYEEEVDKE